jgi:uncharacterized RDD family membrane protein YckC
MDWFYAQDGRQMGPVTESRLNELADSGDVSPDTLVWHSGMPEWQPFRSAFATSAPPLPGDQLRYCNSCGNQFPASDLAMFGESAICAACKPAYVQRLRQGMTSTTTQRFEYGGFWIRFVAYFIDGIILGCARYAITIPLGLETFFNRGTPGLGVFFSVAQLLGSVMGIVYFTYFWTQHGATPGKMIFGLKVVRPDGSPVSIGQSIGRYFCYILDTIIIFIGFMMAGWDTEKRALHDRICDTRVIRTR